MKITYAFAKDNAGLTKIQDKAIRAATSARVAIQIALIATVHHLAQFHDVNMARRLVDGLQETVRGKALVEFLTKYGCLTVGEVITVDKNGKEVKGLSFDGIKGSAEEHSLAIRALFDEAKAKMWWALKQDKPFVGFDMQKALDSVLVQLKSAQKKVVDGKGTADQISTEVNDVTIRTIMAMCNFDIIEPAANVDAAVELLQAA